MTQQTSTGPLPFDAFDQLVTDDERWPWLGFGYLGERANWADRDRDRVLYVDEAILDRADEYGWTMDDLFEWANSKQGRHFADTAFGMSDLDRAFRESFPLPRR